MYTSFSLSSFAHQFALHCVKIAGSHAYTTEIQNCKVAMNPKKCTGEYTPFHKRCISSSVMSSLSFMNNEQIE